MKSTITFIVCAVLVLNCDVRSASDDVLEKLTQTCKLQEKATDAEVAAWNNGLKPEPKIVKCLNACAGETLGMLKNNKLNPDAALKLIQMAPNANEKLVADYKAIIDNCKSITDPDRCEASAKILICLNGGARDQGLDEVF